MIGRDLTECRNDESRLRESEARYRDLYEHAPNAYFSVRAFDATIQDCNVAACQLLGLDKATLLGTKALDFIVRVPDSKRLEHAP